MASAVATVKNMANIAIGIWDHDPGATTAKLASADGGTTIKYVDMRDFSKLLVAVAPTVFASSSGVTKVEIVASADAAFTTPVVVKDSGTIDADAIGDWYALECTAEEIAILGNTLRYAAARVTCSNAGDEALVIYLATDPRFAYADLTDGDGHIA